MHEYVIFVRKDGSRTPVQYIQAIHQMNAVRKGFYGDDGSKPKEELDYEQWLVDMTILAAAKCAENVGKPFPSSNIEALRRAVDISVKAAKTRNLGGE
jgi:hypothetical protein